MILLALCAFFAKQLVWAGLVPLWHFPDEQAHFAQVQNVAHFGNAGFDGNRAATSDSIATSEIIFDTYRDEMGRNKYTFHPEYNLTYTNGINGLWEDLIRNLPARYTHEIGLNEATVYPPLYYYLGSAAYKLGSSASLIEQVYLVRVVSVILFSLIFFPTYLIAQKLFTSKLKKLLLIIMVMFQPMYSFVGSGVTSDILFNLMYAVFLYSAVLLIEKITLKRVVLMILVLFLGSLSKQQMAVAYLTLPFVGMFHITEICAWIRRHAVASISLLVCFAAVSLVAFSYGELFRIGRFITAGTYKGELNDLSLIEHVRWTLVHTYREVIPWYWGIFKWLGVTLPRWTHRVQMGLMALAVIGNIAFWLSVIKRKIATGKLRKEHKYLIFLYVANVMYFTSLLMWDFYFRRAYGFSFGMQGRYYFPVLITHMLFLITGLGEIMRYVSARLGWYDLYRYVLSALGIWWLVLHCIGIWIVVSAYYTLDSANGFIIQASQYKPFIFKGYWWIMWISLFTIVHVTLGLQLLRQTVYEKKTKLSNQNY